jgi:hypothetical protein
MRAGNETKPLAHQVKRQGAQVDLSKFATGRTPQWQTWRGSTDDNSPR